MGLEHWYIGTLWLATSNNLCFELFKVLLQSLNFISTDRKDGGLGMEQEDISAW